MNCKWKLYYGILLFFLCSSIASAQEPRKPNILFILTDDQRWDTLGCYGNDVIRTPNLDKLAAQGARLDTFYVAQPLCCPSRATFLTGLYPHQTGIYTNEKGGADLPKGSKTVAHYLNEAGYKTGFVGKAHIGGDPRKWGFQTCPVFLPGGSSPHKKPDLVYVQREKVPGYITTIFADAAI
ncbi:sulfatase-like hydrolase/transferase, partial [bacterium]|nr:sulfatase-like hydrolase/transferase [bacterium]